MAYWLITLLSWIVWEILQKLWAMSFDAPFYKLVDKTMAPTPTVWAVGYLCRFAKSRSWGLFLEELRSGVPHASLKTLTLFI